jgi:hypothetical protein
MVIICVLGAWAVAAIALAFVVGRMVRLRDDQLGGPDDRHDTDPLDMPGFRSPVDPAVQPPQRTGDPSWQ